MCTAPRCRRECRSSGKSWTGEWRSWGPARGARRRLPRRAPTMLVPSGFVCAARICSGLGLPGRSWGLAPPSAHARLPGRPARRMERLPGLPSAKLGLEAMTGALEDFGFESYLNLPIDSEVAPPDLHSQMEQRLGMAAGTKPMARGLPM